MPGYDLNPCRAGGLSRAPESSAVSALAGPVRVSPPTLMRVPSGLTVNEPGDTFEREADQVAEQVMRMPGPVAAPRSCAAREQEDGL